MVWRIREVGVWRGWKRWEGLLRVGVVFISRLVSRRRRELVERRWRGFLAGRAHPFRTE